MRRIGVLVAAMALAGPLGVGEGRAAAYLDPEAWAAALPSGTATAAVPALPRSQIALTDTLGTRTTNSLPGLAEAPGGALTAALGCAPGGLPGVCRGAYQVEFLLPEPVLGFAGSLVFSADSGIVGQPPRGAPSQRVSLLDEAAIGAALGGRATNCPFRVATAYCGFYGWTFDAPTDRLTFLWSAGRDMPADQGFRITLTDAVFATASAEKAVAVPEPWTVMLLIPALLALGTVALRSRGSC